jgi:hypothetical protein
MTAQISAAWTASLRHRWRAMVVLLAALTLGLSVTGLALRAPSAQAADIALAQCNDIAPGAGGATTAMDCSVTVVNTLIGGVASSVITVSATCANNPCAPAVSPSPFTSPNLVTSVNQCNGSDNDASHPITCTVHITNNIGSDQPGAGSASAATVDQCVGSATTGTPHCSPFPATTSGATVTQCNGSGNGGASATVDCTVTASTVSAAIPVTVNQCNGTGNPGASVVTCSTSITTNIITVTPSASPAPSRSGAPSVAPSVSGIARPTGTIRPTTSGTARPTVSGTARPTATATGIGHPTSTPQPSSRASGSTRPPSSSPSPGTRSSGGSQVSPMPSGGADTGR